MGAVHEQVVARENGMCAVCGLSLDGQGQIHHRQPRGMGGSKKRRDTLANMVHVHASCHSMIESNRAAAYEYGWLVQRGANPEETEMLYRFEWKKLGEDSEQ
jgi:5-methylcytosine-specific restriction protein A